MYSKEQWKHYAEMQIRLHAFAEEYIDEFCWDRASLESVEISEVDISILTESYCYGSVEHDSFSLPIEYLWTENWIELEHKRIEQNKIEEEKKAEEARLTKEQLEEEQERRKYLELQAKYGNNSPVD